MNIYPAFASTTPIITKFERAVTTARITLIALAAIALTLIIQVVRYFSARKVVPQPPENTPSLAPVQKEASNIDTGQKTASATSAVNASDTNNLLKLNAGAIILNGEPRKTFTPLISHYLKALGIDLSTSVLKLNEPGKPHDIEFMIIDAACRGSESFNGNIINIRTRLEIMEKSPTPLILLYTDRSVHDLRLMFYKDTLPKMVRQIIKSRHEQGEPPMKVILAPLVIGGSTKEIDETLATEFKTKFASAKDPYERAKVIAAALTKFLFL